MDLFKHCTKLLLSNKDDTVIPVSDKEGYRLQNYSFAGSSIFVLLSTYDGNLLGQFGVSAPLAWVLPDNQELIFIDLGDPETEFNSHSGCALGRYILDSIDE